MPPYAQKPLSEIVTALKHLPTLHINELDPSTFEVYVEREPSIILSNIQSIECLFKKIFEELSINIEVDCNVDYDIPDEGGYIYRSSRHDHESSATYTIRKDHSAIAVYVDGNINTDRDYYMYAQSNWPGTVESLYIALLQATSYNLSANLPEFGFSYDMEEYIYCHGFFDILDEIESGISSPYNR